MATTLSAAQRKTLLAIMRPLIKEQIGGLIEEEVQRLSSVSSTNYLERILSGQSSSRSSSELPEAGRVFARLGLIAATYEGDRGRALDMARTLDIEAEFKAAQTAGSSEGGGLLVNGDMANDLIGLLRPFSVMRRIGAIGVPIPRGTKTTPKLNVGVSSAYVAEGSPIAVSGIQTGGVYLTAKKLATIAVLTAELSQFSSDRGSFTADKILAGDMLASMGQTEDIKFLFGTGSVAEPLGIVEQAAAANRFDATQAGATATLTEVQTDLRKAEELLLSADIPMQRPVWIMSPRSRLFLRDIRDTDDRGVFGDEMRQTKTINGIPYFESNNVPNNLGGGSNESAVILVDAAQVMIGDVDQVVVDRSTDATLDIDGTETNLFSHDLRAIRTRQWNDIRLRHDVGISVIEAVKWGA